MFTDVETIGVDTPADLAQAEGVLENDPFTSWYTKAGKLVTDNLKVGIAGYGVVGKRRRGHRRPARYADTRRLRPLFQ